MKNEKDSCKHGTGVFSKMQIYCFFFFAAFFFGAFFAAFFFFAAMKITSPF